MFAIRNSKNYIKSLSISRNLVLSSIKHSAYDSDGKTTITIVNKEAGGGVLIDSYSVAGFRLNNGVFVYGPMVLFSKTAFAWNVEGDQDIHAKSLSLFPLIEPKLDLLLIGYGRTAKSHDPSQIHTFRIQNKINMEVLPVDKAIATFNYLCSEGRWVAGAFIPPAEVTIFDGDVYSEVQKKQDDFKTSEIFRA